MSEKEGEHLHDFEWRLHEIKEHYKRLRDAMENFVLQWMQEPSVQDHETKINPKVVQEYLSFYKLEEVANKEWYPLFDYIFSYSLVNFQADYNFDILKKVARNCIKAALDCQLSKIDRPKEGSFQFTGFDKQQEEVLIATLKEEAIYTDICYTRTKALLEKYVAPEYDRDDLEDQEIEIGQNVLTLRRPSEPGDPIASYNQIWAQQFIVECLDNDLDDQIPSAMRDLVSTDFINDCIKRRDKWKMTQEHNEARTNQLRVKFGSSEVTAEEFTQERATRKQLLLEFIELIEKPEEAMNMILDVHDGKLGGAL